MFASLTMAGQFYIGFNYLSLQVDLIVKLKTCKKIRKWHS